MSVFRINKTKDYTIMSNYHLKDQQISLKAKGLLSQMLSLPEEWDYSVQGLVAINRESEVAIKGALDELQKSNYLIISKERNEKGQFEYIYDIYETPEPGVGYPGVENIGLDQPIYNKLLNNKLINKKEINKERKDTMKKPTKEEVEAYCKERNNGIDAQRFIDYYEANGWVQGKSRKPIKDWKACVRTWELRVKVQDKELPNWFNKDQKIEIMNKQEQEEIENILKEIGE